MTWWREAACRRRLDVDFFDDSPQAQAEAVEVCATCPVVAPCRASAVPVGIWGGTTAQARQEVA